MTREIPLRFGWFFSRDSDITTQNPVAPDSDAQFSDFTLEEPENNRRALIERWKKLPRRIESYPAGIYSDGTKYPAGQMLLIGGEQIMGTFENQWCKQTADRMFEGKRGPLTVVMRGFGQGITEEHVYNHMRVAGGKLILMELNQDVARIAKRFAEAKNREVQKMTYRPNLEIDVMEGDADEELAKLPDNSIDLLFSDTHQLQPSELGINDILQPSLLVRKLKPDGKLSICAFHRENQSGYLDDKQREILAPMFDDLNISHAEVLVPKHCVYLRGPYKRLPVLVASGPVK